MRSGLTRRKIVAVFSSVSLFVVAGIPAAALADPPPTPQLLNVTEDVTLTEDWYGSVVVAAPDVTLNCAGHSIIGPGFEAGEEEVEELGGISVEPFSEVGVPVENVTVKNCNVVNHVGGVGVGANYTTLKNNTVDGSARGFGGFGIFSNHNIIQDNTATNVRFDGFLIRGIPPEHGDVPVEGNLLQGNHAENNVSNFSLEFADNNTLVGNVAVGVFGGTGYQIAFSSGNTLRGNTASGLDVGFSFEPPSTGNLLKGNSVSDSGNGFMLNEGTDGNTLDGNSAVDNSNTGFLVLGSNNSLAGNLSSGNNTNGFTVGWGSGNSVDRNRAFDNGFFGFVTFGLNTIPEQTPDPVNEFTRNRACDNNQNGEELGADYGETLAADALLDRNTFCTTIDLP